MDMRDTVFIAFYLIFYYPIKVKMPKKIFKKPKKAAGA